MTNKIWYEMVDMKYGETYLTKYIGLQHRLKKTFKIMTLILSVSGIFGWKYSENYAWIAFILIAIMQLLTLVENQLIRSDQEVEDISTLRMKYTKYFNKLEKIWTEYSKEIRSEIGVFEHFYELRSSDWEPIEELDCKLDIKKFKRLMNQADNETNNYIHKYHNNE
ncbi:MAG: hypothetical protein L0J59_05315 [Lactococcus lactis]|nr:hypothetical protein [Lactococcus lactis]